MKPRKPIRKVSANQARRLRLYRAIRARFILEHPLCEACIPISNRMGYGLQHARFTDDIHHTRGRTGELLFATQFWKAVCRKCHVFIGHYPNVARELGLLCKLGEWGKQPEKIQG